jgi:hypothetical protein
MPTAKPLFAAVAEALGQKYWPDFVYRPDDSLWAGVTIRGSGSIRNPMRLQALLGASAHFWGTKLGCQIRAGEAVVWCWKLLPGGGKGVREALPPDAVWRTERGTGRIYVFDGAGWQPRIADEVVYGELARPSAPGAPVVRTAPAAATEDAQPRSRPAPSPKYDTNRARAELLCVAARPHLPGSLMWSTDRARREGQKVKDDPLLYISNTRLKAAWKTAKEKLREELAER